MDIQKDLNASLSLKILGISGSLRKGSSNTALLTAAKVLASPSAIVEIYKGLSGLPHFNPDLDGDNPPPSVLEFRRAVSSSDALLISTPEYAHGIPGVLKNALDWLVSDTNFEGKPVGVLLGSASDSSFARTALIEVLHTMSARVITNAVISIPGIRVKVSADGRILDEETTAGLLNVLRGFMEAMKK